ncbi:Os12g0483500 [Oryza sativa Japonica Group]|uniref:Os12g0483500 protein n=1 Tax=Oryza sativa subsp. japonica TaxID=39947 RepID=C7J9L8_ORYSJ|nr:Os12g0483500 [Oryza sativa Japonica Group]|eukprot:NP_001176955.1 Os12g0483500 [Oryza sativa Japonica Group]
MALAVDDHEAVADDFRGATFHHRHHALVKNAYLPHILAEGRTVTVRNHLRRLFTDGWRRSGVAAASSEARLRRPLVVLLLCAPTVDEFIPVNPLLGLFVITACGSTGLWKRLEVRKGGDSDGAPTRRMAWEAGRAGRASSPIITGETALVVRRWSWRLVLARF